MQTDKTNTSSNCKSSHKCMLSIILITLLIAGSSYFFVKYNKQSKVIQAQANYINGIKSNILNLTYDDINCHFDRLFGNTWLSPSLLSADLYEIAGSLSIAPRPVNSYYNYSVRNDEYVVTIDLPGFSKEEVAIEATNNILTVKVTKHPSEQSNIATNSKNIGQTQVLTQSIRIPGSINQDNIRASFNKGLLTINLPRICGKTSKETKKISIN